uniref:Calponin-homology (CH) domain-containing protein n=1 Tax=Ditylenchus dipsaci TaxID=166011 RepID=A0A915ELI0_9BILA
MLDANLNHRAKKPVTSTFTYSSNGQAAGPLDSPCSSISGGNSAITQQLDYAASVSSLATSSIMDNAESECLEHYESNLEKYKDERDTIQKKTFTKWVNKHLTKSGRQVENLFRDLQNGVNLISLLESLSDETLPRENGLTRFHSIQNVHYCLDFLRKKHIKLVNIRPEDIVDGNGKLTLGLIWTIILNFQVSVINQRRLQQKQQISSRTTTEELVKVTNGNGQTQPLTSSYTSLTKKAHFHPTTVITIHQHHPKTTVVVVHTDSGAIATLASQKRRKTHGIHENSSSIGNLSQQRREQSASAALGSHSNVHHSSSNSHHQSRSASHPTDLAEKNAIVILEVVEMAWPQLEGSLWSAWSSAAEGAAGTRGFSESSTYEAKEHYERVRANISESHHLVGDGISARDALLQWARRLERWASLQRNFASLRPSAVNWNKISETSVTSRERLSNAFDAFEKEFNISKLLDPEDVDVDNPDEKSVLTYVSSLYNTLAQDEFSKGTADDLLKASIGSVAASEVERNVRIIVEDLDVLEAPIADYFEDVETLKANRHPHAQDLHRQVFGLHQRRGAYLDRLTNQILVRIGVRVKEVSERYEMTRTNAFQRVEESVRWVRERTEKLNVMQFSETLEVLEEMFERHKLDNRDIQDYRQIVDQCIARQAEVSAEDSYEYCELLQTLESEYQQLRDLSAGRMLDWLASSD